MCGIAGFINFKEGRELAIRANFLQRHRGPDHQSIWAENGVALCSQRLSIIDLADRSNQPLHKQGLVIIYNGELYNYRELRDDLAKNSGVQFSTESDTEVVLEMYRKMGKKCLDHFLGMFAFAIYNIGTGNLFLARDHFGIKPLFYFSSGNQLAFSSELKTLLEIPGLSRQVNHSSLVGALNFSWIPGDQTMISGFLKLPPGHFLELSSQSGVKVECYWELEPTESLLDEGQWLEELDSTIQGSIDRHMVADVPVSSFLSGGLDSSLISVLAGKHNVNLSTYTIATLAKDKEVEKMPSDEVFAAELAKSMGFDHHQILIEPEIIQELPRIVRSLDEPIGDPAAINTNLICAAARNQGVKVLLSGIGADEIFFGYRRHRATLLAERYQKVPLVFRRPIDQVVRSMPVRVMGQGFKLGRWGKRFSGFANLPIPDAYLRSYSYYDQNDLEELVVKPIMEQYRELRDQHNQVFSSVYPEDVVNRMCFTDLHYFLPGLNLAYTDRASMASSVEVRVPFVDKLVVETAMKVPGSLKYKNGQSKYILKRLAERYLPKKFVHRPKASFGVPLRSWISGELAEMVGDVLSSSSIKERGVFNFQAIDNMIQKDRAGLDDFSYQLYQLLTLELWFREFLDDSHGRDRK